MDDKTFLTLLDERIPLPSNLTKLEKTRMKSIINKTIELISKGWCQGKSATNKYGHSINYMDDKACNFCMSGAFSRAYYINIPKNRSNYYVAVANLQPIIKREIFKYVHKSKVMSKEEKQLYYGAILSKYSYSYASYMPVFNDNQHTTKKKVLNVLDKVVEQIDQL